MKTVNSDRHDGYCAERTTHIVSRPKSWTALADSYSSSSDTSGGGDDWEGGRGDMDMGGGGMPDFGGVGFGGTETGERAATGTARHRRLNSVVAGKGTRKGLTNCPTKKPLRAPGKAARLLFSVGITLDCSTDLGCHAQLRNQECVRPLAAVCGTESVVLSYKGRNGIVCRTRFTIMDSGKQLCCRWLRANAVAVGACAPARIYRCAMAGPGSLFLLQCLGLNPCSVYAA